MLLERDALGFWSNIVLAADSRKSIGNDAASLAEARSRFATRDHLHQTLVRLALPGTKLWLSAMTQANASGECDEKGARDRRDCRWTHGD
jgi:hypothetical protein